MNIFCNFILLFDIFRYHRYIPVNDSEALKQEVARINAEQYIHNLGKYQLNLDSESLVIVIQTHDRAEYLRILLNSMRNIRDIEKSLLIVSHDVYSNELNAIIEAVDFCPVSWFQVTVMINHIRRC